MKDNNNYLVNYWEPIRNRLHEESGLQHPMNAIGQMFEVFFNNMLNQFSEDNSIFLDQGFLLTAEGLYLDIYGSEMGLPRHEGEYASGYVIFLLTREISKTSTPEQVENETEGGTVYDFRPEDVQEILNRLNAERKTDGSVDTLLELREAESDITIFKNTPLYSYLGFEYVTTEEVVLPQGQKFVSVRVVAKESGERYNLEETSDKDNLQESLLTFNAVDINRDLLVMNTSAINGGVDGESDGDYRRRLLNNRSVNISVNFLKNQGIIIYSKKYIDDDIRTKMTSLNPYMSNLYALIPPNNEVFDFTTYDLIADYSVVIYIRGW